MEQIIATLAQHGQRLDTLEEYQEKQNGSLQRLEAKVDKIYIWLIGVLGGVITSLALLIANILAGR